jgi:hypothetical protein
MAITLAEAQTNTQDDIDFAIIDELRRYSWLLDQVTWDDVVNPSGGGATLTYGYTRLIAPRGASWRPYNENYTADAATRQRFTVDLSPLGGTYQLDRVLAHLGPRATDEMAFQVSELLTGVRMKFSEEIIRGDVSNNPDMDAEDSGAGSAGFDGLDVSLAGTVTELGADETPGEGDASGSDWTAVNSDQDAFDAIERLEEMLSLLNGQPGAIMTNRHGMIKLSSIGRRAGYLTESEDAMGRRITTFAGIPIVDLGDTNDSAGSAEPIIPTEGRTIGDDTEETSGVTDIYAVRFGMNAFHGVSVAGPLVRQWEPDWDTSGAVKTGEVEMGPVAMVLKNTRTAGVLRNVKVR